MMPEASAHPTLAIQAAGAADTGRARSHNKDAVLLRPDLRLWVIADGAGGHAAGNVASTLAVAAIANHFESTERDYRKLPDVDRFGIPAGARRLSLAIRKASRDVVEISKSSQKFGGMGSTVVAITVAARSPTLHVAHVGDSRCYRLRDGRLEQLTRDHSLLNDVIEMYPDLADEAVAKLPRKVVTRALGMEESVRPTVQSFAVAADDLYLLCSDGLTSELGDEQIRRVLSLPEPPAALVDRLIRAANEAGGGDNIAVIVVRMDVSAAEDETGPLAELLEPESTRASSTLRPQPFLSPGSADRAPDTLVTPAADSAPPTLAVPARPPPRPEMVSAPEILLLGIESEVDPEEAPAVRVVPESSATSGLFRAIGDLLPPRRPKSSPGFCATCGGEAPAEAVFCPRCGMRRTTIP
jgi:PPM family protein phosphatase